MANPRHRVLKADIAKNGITNAIPYVNHNGTRYLVGGHHRVRIAKELGLKNVPVVEVKLPYAGYRNTNDLIYTRY
ncbi:ParB N-terminal domain-containing protein [Aquimarina macrocephali]|uniref:ParB N-terminal domain-containing protein n=1 Tax=Aquimarina macrocephali TaxID=666563 RepID=UPI003F662E49